MYKHYYSIYSSILGELTLQLLLKIKTNKGPPQTVVKETAVGNPLKFIIALVPLSFQF